MQNLVSGQGADEWCPQGSKYGPAPSPPWLSAPVGQPKLHAYSAGLPRTTAVCWSSGWDRTPNATHSENSRDDHHYDRHACARKLSV